MLCYMHFFEDPVITLICNHPAGTVALLQCNTHYKNS
jgi:hypothetical protein